MLSSPSGGSGPWAGDPLRVFLRGELASKISPEVSRIYWEAIRVLDDSSNPERHAVCCYLLREIQDALPRDLIGRKSEPKTAGYVIDWVETEWKRLAETPGRVESDGRWKGRLQGSVATFLYKLGTRVGLYRADHPRHKDQHLRAFMVLDPALGGISERARLDLVNAWMQFTAYFNGGLHHNRLDPVECEAQVRAFEEFVGKRLNPPTFANRDRIAQLVREVEGRADR